MKKFIMLLTCALIVLDIDAYADTNKEGTSILPNGKTSIYYKFDKINIHLTIKTKEVQIGKPSDKRPVHIYSSCTYSRYPCSLVEAIEILVDGKSIFVPRSVFCDLADLNSGMIQYLKNEFVLTMTGGDASEAYVVKVYFNTDQIKRRLRASYQTPDEPLQETIYHVQTIGED